MEFTDEYAQFFTATILEWKLLLKPDKFKQIITNSLSYMVTSKRLQVFGFVIMNNHVHIMWQSMVGYTKESNQLSFMKFTAQMIIKELRNNHPEVLDHFQVNLRDRKYQIWERNPLSIELRTLPIFEQKLNYIHNNPVKAGLCSFPEEYQYSSAAYYICNKDEWGFITSIYA